MVVLSAISIEIIHFLSRYPQNVHCTPSCICTHQFAAIHDKKSVRLAALMHHSTEEKASVHMVQHMIFSSVLIINNML